MSIEEDTYLSQDETLSRRVDTLRSVDSSQLKTEITSTKEEDTYLSQDETISRRVDTFRSVDAISSQRTPEIAATKDFASEVSGLTRSPLSKNVGYLSPKNSFETVVYDSPPSTELDFETEEVNSYYASGIPSGIVMEQSEERETDQDQPPRADEQFSVDFATSFNAVSSGPIAARDRAEMAIREAGCDCYVLSRFQLCGKAFLGAQVATFFVNLFLVAAATAQCPKTSYMFEFQRRSGDVIAFCHRFRMIMSILGDFVVSAVHKDYEVTQNMNENYLDTYRFRQQHVDLGLDLQDDCLSNFSRTMLNPKTPYESKKQFAELYRFGSTRCSQRMSFHSLTVPTITYLLQSLDEDLARCGITSLCNILIDPSCQEFLQNESSNFISFIRDLFKEDRHHFRSDTLFRCAVQALAQIAEVHASHVKAASFMDILDRLEKGSPDEKTRSFASIALRNCGVPAQPPSN